MTSCLADSDTEDTGAGREAGGLRDVNGPGSGGHHRIRDTGRDEPLPAEQGGGLQTHDAGIPAGTDQLLSTGGWQSVKV